MTIKSVLDGIKGLFKGEIPGYIKIKLSDEKLRTTLDIFEEDLWENISQSDLRFVGEAMLTKLYFSFKKINHLDEIQKLREIRDKLISDIKKLENA